MCLPLLSTVIRGELVDGIDGEKKKRKNEGRFRSSRVKGANAFVGRASAEKQASRIPDNARDLGLARAFRIGSRPTGSKYSIMGNVKWGFLLDRPRFSMDV